PADSDGVVGHAETDIGRAEVLVPVAGGATAEIHEALKAQPDLGQIWIEKIVHQRRLEVVAAGGDRGGGGEDGAGAGGGAGVGSRKAGRAMRRASSSGG